MEEIKELLFCWSFLVHLALDSDQGFLYAHINLMLP